MKLNRDIFRGFSVRGVVGRDLDVERMAIIGKATGSWLQRQGSHNLVVGHDVRLSSPQLHQALIRGILETGTDVIDIGQTPTPLLNFAVDYYKAAGGVMVTASHNPQDYNGLKIRTARTIYGDDLQQIYEIAEKGEFISGAGKYKAADPTSAYSEALSRRIELRRPLHVVVDGGNGMNGLVVPPLLRKAGCRVSEIFCDPDGSFPNRDPDPGAKGAMQALAQIVLREKADLGMAFDGDGDRVILVDDAGQTILGDTALMLLARQVLARGNPIKVVYEVLCSQAVPDDILSHGGEAIAAPSGYAFVHNALLASGATLGGEMAGHFFLLDDEFRFDDAILAAVRLVSLISCQTLPLSKLVSQLPHYHSSHEFRLPCPDAIKSKIVAEMAEFFRSRYPIDTIDGVRVLFGDGSALIRQSNTQPVLSLRFEAKTSIERLESIQEEVLLQVRDCYRQFGLEWPAS